MRFKLSKLFLVFLGLVAVLIIFLGGAVTADYIIPPRPFVGSYPPQTPNCQDENAKNQGVLQHAAKQKAEEALSKVNENTILEAIVDYHLSCGGLVPPGGLFPPAGSLLYPGDRFLSQCTSKIISLDLGVCPLPSRLTVSGCAPPMIGGGASRKFVGENLRLFHVPFTLPNGTIKYVNAEADKLEAVLGASGIATRVRSIIDWLKNFGQVGEYNIGFAGGAGYGTVIGLKIFPEDPNSSFRGATIGFGENSIIFKCEWQR